MILVPLPSNFRARCPASTGDMPCAEHVAESWPTPIRLSHLLAPGQEGESWVAGFVASAKAICPWRVVTVEVQARPTGPDSWQPAHEGCQHPSHESQFRPL